MTGQVWKMGIGMEDRGLRIEGWGWGLGLGIGIERIDKKFDS